MEDRTKTDCFGYINRNGHKSCYGLNKLYCENENCNFYRKDIKVSNIESDLRKYKK